MSGKYKLLLKMQMYHLFGINRLRHSHNQKEKASLLAMGAAGILLVGILLFMSCGASLVFASAGLTSLLPTLMLVSDSVLVLFLTFLKSQGSLIGTKDYDMLISLPVNSAAIVCSKLTMIYLVNLGIGLIIMTPASVVYVVQTQAGRGACAFLAASLLLAPLLPMTVSLALGIVISVLSAKSRRSNILALLGSTVCILLFVAAASRMDSLDTAQLANLGAELTKAATKLYPPAAAFAKGLSGNMVGIFQFVAVSVAPLAVFIAVVSRFYQQFNTRAFSHHAEHHFHLHELAVSSPFMALYRKEMARFFSCTIYALNSAIVMALLLAASILSAVFGADILLQQLEAAGVAQVTGSIFPLAVSVCVCMSCTTSASLSLEGKNRWLMCSAPVASTVVFHSKIAVNLSVVLPMLWVSCLLLRMSFPMTVAQTVFLFLTPTVYAIFISVSGMLCNVKFPRYDWTSEYYAVKGGAFSVLLSISIGLISCMIPLVLCMLSLKDSLFIVALTNGVILILTVAIDRKLSRMSLYV